MSSFGESALPTSIAIRNFFPSSLPSIKEQRNQNGNSIAKHSCMKRSEYTNLTPCRLDIIQKSLDGENDVKTIFSRSSGGAHPHWNHLNEQDINLAGDDSLLFARFSVDDRSVEIPLHPSKLKCISQSDTMQIPSSLAPNAILIHYDDGWTRVIPSLYFLLLRRQIIDECVESQTENGDVFSESVFDVLGGASKDNQAPSENMKEKDSLYDDKVFDLLGGATSESKASENTIVNGDGNEFSHSISKDPIIGTDLMTKTDQIEDSTIEAENTMTSIESCDVKDGLLPNPLNPAPSSLHNKLLDSPILSKMTKSNDIHRTQKEVADLRQKLQLEQELLKRDEMLIHQEAETLKLLVKEVQRMQAETGAMINQTGIERVELFRANFRFETHRSHLLKHLRQIFPIKIVRLSVDANGTTPNPYPSQHQFTIAGVPLPDDIHHPATSDDQVSTALGFTCHLMALISKYLDIPMRYRIVPKFSRSAIIDEGRGGIKSAYPLFRERGVVDKEQLDHGLMLFTRNADALLRRRQIEFREEWNILAKLDRLQSNLIDGKEY